MGSLLAPEADGWKTPTATWQSVRTAVVVDSHEGKQWAHLALENKLWQDKIYALSNSVFGFYKRKDLKDED